ncbi:MAG: hypothetical protein ACJA1E_000735 [Paracoccaceae bacterium]|jgi:hypothetical protein
MDPQHFIAIHHHRYHAAKGVEAAVKSVVQATRHLPAGSARMVFFYDPESDLPADIHDLLARLGVEKVMGFAASSGARLNSQIDMAIAAKAQIFYRVDADDVVAPRRFAHQATMFATSEIDVCGGGLTYAVNDTHEHFDVIPKAIPGPWDYLLNCAMLHPTLAFRLDTFQKAGLRYWDQRLEDKHLGLQIRKAGLVLKNAPMILGHYHLDPASRSSAQAALLNLSLNKAYLKATRRFDLLPLAYLIFVSSMLAPSHQLRRMRQWMQRRPFSSASKSGGENDTTKTTRQPPE